MGERSLRGSRLGSVSYETERNTAPIERPDQVGATVRDFLGRRVDGDTAARG